MSGWPGYNVPYSSSSYVEAPAPPMAPMPGGYGMDYGNSPTILTADPGSPLVYPVSPTGGMSPMHSRDSSRHRDEPSILIPDGRGRDRAYHSSHLGVSASSQALSRSNSERSRNRSGSGKPLVYVEVAKSSRGRNGRSTSVGAQYYYDDAAKRDGSVYSNSSYGSRGHSRSHSKVRHSRSPSCGSCDSYEEHHHDQYAVGPYRGEKDLSVQLREVQAQLEAVRSDTEKRKQEEEKRKQELEDAKKDKLRTQEIERRVTEQMLLAKKKEDEVRAAKQKALEEEKARIKAEAEKLLQERAAEEKRKKDAEEAKKAEVQALINEERAKWEAMNAAMTQGRKTYTKFSKVHLCKEALDERAIAYTEESEHFLVHRAVDKTEQNYLWTRTKEIRNYYRQIQEAADRAPTVRTADGSWVKYVQIAGQPQPIALPVTFTQTPGGGQTQRVDPIKIKWTDIFRPQKF